MQMKCSTSCQWNEHRNCFSKSPVEVDVLILYLWKFCMNRVQIISYTLTVSVLNKKWKKTRVLQWHLSGVFCCPVLCWAYFLWRPLYWWQNPLQKLFSGEGWGWSSGFGLKPTTGFAAQTKSPLWFIYSVTCLWVQWKGKDCLHYAKVVFLSSWRCHSIFYESISSHYKALMLKLLALVCNAM